MTTAYLLPEPTPLTQYDGTNSAAILAADEWASFLAYPPNAADVDETGGVITVTWDSGGIPATYVINTGDWVGPSPMQGIPDHASGHMWFYL